MNPKPIQSKFAAMGARLKVREFPSVLREVNGQRVSLIDYAVDIQRDARGEHFELRVPSHLTRSLEVTVLQAEPWRRHLLLLVRKPGAQSKLDRFLCGHDEREWFVAAVPGGASSVRQAMDALQPAEVREALARQNVPSRKRHTRRNDAFRRQGEWFFVPEPGLVVSESLILRNEPIRRGGGKPHLIAELHRTEGETVHVCDKHPNGLTPDEYRSILLSEPGAISWRWTVMRRNARAYARGTVRHADHAVITLPCWHRVLMNTENQSGAMSNMAFLD